MYGTNFSVNRSSKYRRSLPGRLHMAPQIEIGPVVNAFEFLPAERILIFDIVRRLGVVGQFVRRRAGASGVSPS